MLTDPAKFPQRQARLIGYAPKFAAIVAELEAHGDIRAVKQIGPSAYQAEETGDGFGVAAYRAAEVCSDGAFYITGHNSGMRWAMGDMSAGVIIDASEADVIESAQEIVRNVIPPHERPPVAWTVGGNGRILLNWAMEAQQGTTGWAENLVAARGQTDGGDEAEYDDEQNYQYHNCIPGKYDRAEMWDVESCYFNAIKRLPCLRCIVTPGNVRWERWIGSEAERWRDVIQAIEPHHLLRNSLWGVMLGSHMAKRAYTSAPSRDRATRKLDGVYKRGDVRCLAPVFGTGPYRPSALIVCRSMAEVCALAAEEVESVYSTVDSVTAITGARPYAWDRVGFRARIKETGPADIVARGCWKIGDRHKRPYYKYKTAPPPDYVCPVPLTPIRRYSYTTNYHRLWLA